MKFFNDNNWHHRRILTEDETINQFSKDFYETRIRFTISSNLMGGSTEAKIFCHLPTGKNIYPSIQICCTGLDEVEVINYLLEAWARVDNLFMKGK